MAATRAVFDTAELLENIILYLPASEIKATKLMANIWRNVIRSSQRIKKDRRLAKPSKVPLHDSEGDGVGHLNFPRYAVGCRLTLHPMLEHHYTFHLKYSETDRYWKCLSLGYPPRQSTASEFLTHPPCQALQAEGCLPHDALRCTLYIKDGIRVKDFMELAMPFALREPDMRITVNWEEAR